MSTINEYIIDVEERTPGPVSGAGECCSFSTVILALLVVLVLVVVVALWRRRYYFAKPDCSKAPPGLAGRCRAAVSVCGDNEPCLNAVAQCAPIAEKVAAARNPLGALGHVSRWDMNRCATAVARVDPKFAAAALANSPSLNPLAHPGLGLHACLPGSVSSYLDSMSPAEMKGAVNIAAVSEKITPWGLEVASHLPACAKPHPH